MLFSVCVCEHGQSVTHADTNSYTVGAIAVATADPSVVCYEE